MRWAAKGVWPTEGFAREAFDPKSFRYKYRGKTIANKWRQGVVSFLSLHWFVHHGWSVLKSYLNSMDHNASTPKHGCRVRSLKVGLLWVSVWCQSQGPTQLFWALVSVPAPMRTVHVSTTHSKAWSQHELPELQRHMSSLSHLLDWQRLQGHVQTTFTVDSHGGMAPAILFSRCYAYDILGHWPRHRIKHFGWHAGLWSFGTGNPGWTTS